MVKGHVDLISVCKKHSGGLEADNHSLVNLVRDCFTEVYLRKVTQLTNDWIRSVN